MIDRAEKILMPARKYLTIVGLFQSKSRLIGSGLIGGKAVDCFGPDDPYRRPLEYKIFFQRKVALLDLKEISLTTISSQELIRRLIARLPLFASKGYTAGVRRKNPIGF